MDKFFIKFIKRIDYIEKNRKKYKSSGYLGIAIIIIILLIIVLLRITKTIGSTIGSTSGTTIETMNKISSPKPLNKNKPTSQQILNDNQ